MRLALAVAVLCGVALSAAAPVAFGQAQVLPNPKVPAVHGVRLTLDYTWLDGYGYRPVRVQVNPLAPSVADRTVTVRLRAMGNSFVRESIASEQDIEIPAGATAAAATIALPQYDFFWYCLGWDVWVDGSYAKELSVDPRSNFINNSRVDTETPRVLAVAENPAEELALGVQLGAATPPPAPATSFPLNSPMATPNLSGAIPAVHAIPISALPQRWIEYSCVDVVYTSYGNLAAASRKHPRAFAALRDWVSAGGNLWVYDVGAAWEHRADLEALLGMESLPDDAAAPSWQGPPKEVRWKTENEPEEYYVAPAEDLSEPGVNEANGERGSAKPAVQTKPLSSPQLLERNFRLGQVVALASAEPFIDATTSTAKSWNFIETADPNRTRWILRHGVNVAEGCSEFWNFTIPGVGLAPVTEFLVIITIFVIAIGPVNYIVLRRIKRLHLLLVTVPLSALVITLALFGYALVCDGLQTRLRIRSLTLLDQHTGEAVSWSRQSYYAGLTPRGGLTFSERTVVVPLGAQDETYGNPYRRPAAGQMLQMEWAQDQHLTRGWLAARTPKQYLVMRSAPLEEKLEIRPAGDRLEVANLLGTHVKQVLVCDGSGQFFSGASIGPGARAALAPLSRNEGIERLRSLFTANAPAFPPEWSAAYRNNMFGNNYYAYSYNESAGPGLLNVNVSENVLRDTLRAGPHSPLVPGTYVAIVDRSPHVELGVEAPLEEGSFHVVLGTW